MPRLRRRDATHRRSASHETQAILLRYVVTRTTSAPHASFALFRPPVSTVGRRSARSPMVHRRFSHHPLLTRPTRASEARPFQALRAPVTSNLRRTPACSSHPGLSRLDRARRFPHSGQRTAASFNPAYVRPAIAPPAQIAPRASHNPPDSRCLGTDSHSSFNSSNRGHLELLLDVAVRPEQ